MLQSMVVVFEIELISYAIVEFLMRDSNYRGINSGDVLDKYLDAIAGLGLNYEVELCLTQGYGIWKVSISNIKVGFPWVSLSKIRDGFTWFSHSKIQDDFK